MLLGYTLPSSVLVVLPLQYYLDNTNARVNVAPVLSFSSFSFLRFACILRVLQTLSGWNSVDFILMKMMIKWWLISLMWVSHTRMNSWAVLTGLSSHLLQTGDKDWFYSFFLWLQIWSFTWATQSYFLDAKWISAEFSHHSLTEANKCALIFLFLCCIIRNISVCMYNKVYFCHKLMFPMHMMHETMILMYTNKTVCQIHPTDTICR